VYNVGKQSEIQYRTNMKTVADDYFEQGIEFGVAGEHEKAIDCFSNAIKLNSGNAIAYYNRGTAYGESGQYEKAIEDFSQSIELNP
jgi:tetratricopeptide (TPR) repeat protein